MALNQPYQIPYPTQGFPRYPYPQQSYQSSPLYAGYQPPVVAQQQQAVAAQQPQQIQNGGFISVRSIEEAKNYPVAPGNSVTFKDENSPYVYTKTMGFSQLDRPIFEVYRLVKEDGLQQPQEAQEGAGSSLVKDSKEYALKSEIEALERRVEEINGLVEAMREKLDRPGRPERSPLNQSGRSKERRRDGKEAEYE